MTNDLFEKLDKMSKIKNEIDKVEEMDSYFALNILFVLIAIFISFLVFFFVNNLTEEYVISTIFALFALIPLIYRTIKDQKEKDLVLEKFKSLTNALIQLRLEYDNVLHTITEEEVLILRDKKYDVKKIKSNHHYVIKDLLNIKGFRKRKKRRLVKY